MKVLLLSKIKLTKEQTSLLTWLQLSKNNQPQNKLRIKVKLAWSDLIFKVIKISMPSQFSLRVNKTLCCAKS